jgi:hypothetical protein
MANLKSKPMKIKTIQEISKFVKALMNQLATAERFFELSNEVYSETLIRGKGTEFNELFIQLYRSLQESTFSHLTRVFYYGKDSVGLVYFLDQIQSNRNITALLKANTQIDAAQLKKDLESISKGSKKCRPQIKKLFRMRDKYFAHYDLKHAVGKKDLPVINFAYLNYAVAHGKRLLFKYADHFQWNEHNVTTGYHYGFNKEFNFEKGQLKRLLGYYKSIREIEGIVKKTMKAK